MRKPTKAVTAATEPTGEAAPEPGKHDAAISAWVSQHIYDSPVSRNTEAFNHLVSVLPHLKSKLAEEG